MFNPRSKSHATATATAGSPSSKAGAGVYRVLAYDQKGLFLTVISGMGRHRGTWSTDHGRRSAQRHAKALRIEHPELRFRVESS